MLLTAIFIWSLRKPFRASEPTLQKIVNVIFHTSNRILKAVVIVGDFDGLKTIVIAGMH